MMKFIKNLRVFKTISLSIVWVFSVLGVSVADTVYRDVVLENGFQAMLISDPGAPFSAASMTVGAGALCDPRDKQGLAHFVEHLLFQGSGRYPSPGEFQKFIIRNGGYYYADTGLDCTNYGFQIRNGGFSEALARFADFFKAPLMAEETISAELKIIDDEFQKFSTSDAYTVAAVKSRFYKDGHPMKNMLMGGNSKTLKSATRKDAKAFFNTYYRPSIMTLAVVGTQSLDELEGAVRSLFSALLPGKLENMPECRDFIEEKNTVEIVHISTNNNYKMLYLDFALECEKDDWVGRPMHLMRSLLESNAPGSLLALLRQERLATDIAVNTLENAKAVTGTGCTISINLTDKGYEEHKRVLNLFFAEISLLKSNGFPDAIFKKKKASALEDAAMARTLTGLGLTRPAAFSMQSYPAKQVADLNFIHVMEKNEMAYYKILEQIRPSRMIASLLTQNLKEGAREPHYGTIYECVDAGEPFYMQLLMPERHESLYMPAINVVEETPKIATNDASYLDAPVSLIQGAGKSLILVKNNVFGTNNVSLRIRLSFLEDNVALKDAAKLELLAAMLKEAWPMWAGQEATLSGVGLVLDSMPHQLILEITGQSVKVGHAAVAIASFLAAPDVGSFFAAVKSKLVSAYGNYYSQDAYIKAWGYCNAIAHNHSWRYQDYISHIESSKGDDIVAYARRICASSKLDALVFGDVNETNARKIFDEFATVIGHGTPVDNAYSRSKILKVEPGENVIFWEPHPSRNSGIHIAYHGVGGASPEDMAAAMLIGRFIGGAFHAKMCIEDKIAYVATAYVHDAVYQSQAYFDIQSSRIPADELLGKADLLLQQLPAIFEDISDEHWRDIVGGVRDEINRRPLSITESVRRYFDLAFERNGNWEWRTMLTKAVNKTKKRDVLELLRKTFDRQTRRRIVVVESGNNQQSSRHPTVPCSFEEIEKWKNTRAYE